MAGGFDTFSSITAEELSKIPVSYKKEANLCDNVESSIHEFVELSGLPEMESYDREYVFGRKKSRNTSIGRADFLVRHKNGSITIIEVKRIKSFNDIMCVIAQLMFYREMVNDANLIAIIDGPFYQIAHSVCKRYGIHIKWFMARLDGFSLLEITEQ